MHLYNKFQVVNLVPFLDSMVSSTHLCRSIPGSVLWNLLAFGAQGTSDLEAGLPIRASGCWLGT